MQLYYLALLLSWLVFGVIHSITASNWFKHWLLARRLFPVGYYRFLYNVMSIVSFAPVLLILLGAPNDPNRVDTGVEWLGLLVMAGGLLLLVKAFKGYDLHEFMGWPPPTARSSVNTFRRSGLLNYVRHPLYLATIIILIGLFIWRSDLLHFLVGFFAFLYIRIGIYYEERKLIKEFGDIYLEYRCQVPMLFPRLSQVLRQKQSA